MFLFFRICILVNNSGKRKSECGSSIDIKKFIFFVEGEIK